MSNPTPPGARIMHARAHEEEGGKGDEQERGQRGVSEWQWAFHSGDGGSTAVGVGVSEWESGFCSGSRGFVVGMGFSQWEWGFQSGNGGFTVGMGVSQ